MGFSGIQFFGLPILEQRKSSMLKKNWRLKNFRPSSEKAVQASQWPGQSVCISQSIPRTTRLALVPAAVSPKAHGSLRTPYGCQCGVESNSEGREERRATHSRIMPPHEEETAHPLSSQWPWRIARPTRICWTRHACTPRRRNIEAAQARAFMGIVARVVDLGGETSPLGFCL
jgi:hypothetical protein